MIKPIEIIALVATITGIPTREITGSRRSMHISYARFLAAADIRQCYPWWSCKRIGEYLGGRESGTVRKALIRHAELLVDEPSYLALWQQITAARLKTTPPNHACTNP